MTLREYFENDVSPRAFRQIDGEQRIIGKLGQVSMVGGLFDVWVVRPDFEPISARKLGAIRKKLEQIEGFRLLDGEGYYQTEDPEKVRQALEIIGIRKRRRDSREVAQAKRERLARYRPQREAA